MKWVIVAALVGALVVAFSVRGRRRSSGWRSKALAILGAIAWVAALVLLARAV